MAEREILQFKNFDLDSVKTPVDYLKLKELLELSSYDQKEIDFLVDGFKNGFSIGYEGPEKISQGTQSQI